MRRETATSEKVEQQRRDERPMIKKGALPCIHAQETAADNRRDYPWLPQGANATGSAP
jgi:hypothetical protein